MMEQSEEYLKAVARIQVLEQQVVLCSKAEREFEESGVQSQHLIEEHFGMYMNALAARKAALLEAVQQNISVQSI